MGTGTGPGTRVAAGVRSDARARVGMEIETRANTGVETGNGVGLWSTGYLLSLLWKIRDLKAVGL